MNGTQPLPRKGVTPNVDVWPGKSASCLFSAFSRIPGGQRPQNLTMTFMDLRSFIAR